MANAGLSANGFRDDARRRPGRAAVSRSLACALFACSILLPGQSAGAEISTESGVIPSGKQDPAALAKEGETLARSNKNDLAVEKLRECTAIAPEMAEAHHALGVVLAKLGNMPEAISEMRRAVELSPANDSSLLTLGALYQSNGNIEEAVSTYDEFLNRFQNSAMKGKVEALKQALIKERETRERQHSHNQQLTDTAKDALQNKSSSTGNDDYLAFMQENGGFKRWPQSRLPVTVFIHDGNNIAGYRDNLRTILLRSFDDWSKASQGLVQFRIVERSDDARLQCFWTNRVSDLNTPAEAGDARLFLDENSISKAEIWFLTKPQTKLTDNQFRLITLHEIGHALGLSGHTTNPDDIMFFSSSFKDTWRELSGRDARSIIRMYQSEALDPIAVAIRANMRTYQIAAESYAADAAVYPKTTAELEPYLPGGENKIGGKQGKRPANPVITADPELVFDAGIRTAAELQKIRTGEMQLPRVGKPGQLGYSVIDGGRGYAIIGIDNQGRPVLGTSGKPLLFSNQ